MSAGSPVRPPSNLPICTFSVLDAQAREVRALTSTLSNQLQNLSGFLITPTPGLSIPDIYETAGPLENQFNILQDVKSSLVFATEILSCIGEKLGVEVNSERPNVMPAPLRNSGPHSEFGGRK